MTDIPSHQLEPRATFNVPESLRTPGQEVVEKAIKDITALEKVVAQELELPEGTSELSKATDELLADVAEGAIENEREHPGAETHAAALARVEDAIIRTGLEASAHYPDMKTSPAIILELGDHGDRIDQAMTDLASVHAQTPEGEDLTKLVAQQIDALPHAEATGNETIVIPVTSAADAAEVVGYNPGKEVKLYDGRNEHRFGIRGELSPFERREFTLPDGTRRAVNILAEITAASSPHTFVLAERMGQFAGITTNEDGTIKVDPMLSNHTTFHDSNQLYTVERLDIGKDGLSWRFFQSGWEKRKVAIKLSDNAEVVDHPKTTSEITREKEQNKERLKKWGKRAIGAMAVWATISSGGFGDRIGESIVNTDQVIAAVAADNITEPYTMDTILDGIEIRDYPHPQELIDERNKEIFEKQQKYEQASQGVREALRDLDTHDYELIEKRALEYRTAHPGELMDKHELAQLIHGIEVATTGAEVIAVANKISSFYDIEVQTSETDIDALRHTSLNVFEALGTLPLTVVKQSQLKKINLGTYDDVASGHEGVKGAVQGEYSESENTVTLLCSSRQNENIKKVATYLPGSQGYSIKSVFLHEFGHALSLKGKVGSSSESRQIADNIYLSTGLDIVRSGLANYPETISTYSRENYMESMAENLSGVMSSRSDGLAHPDEARRFNSPANKVLIENLMELEALQPGLANYFISINPRLMNRSALTFGR